MSNGAKIAPGGENTVASAEQTAVLTQLASTTTPCCSNCTPSIVDIYSGLTRRLRLLSIQLFSPATTKTYGTAQAPNVPPPHFPIRELWNPHDLPAHHSLILVSSRLTLGHGAGKLLRGWAQGNGTFPVS